MVSHFSNSSRIWFGHVYKQNAPPCKFWLAILEKWSEIGQWPAVILQSLIWRPSLWQFHCHVQIFRELEWSLMILNEFAKVCQGALTVDSGRNWLNSTGISSRICLNSSTSHLQHLSGLRNESEVSKGYWIINLCLVQIQGFVAMQYSELSDFLIRKRLSSEVKYSILQNPASFLPRKQEQQRQETIRYTTMICEHTLWRTRTWSQKQILC